MVYKARNAGDAGCVKDGAQPGCFLSPLLSAHHGHAIGFSGCIVTTPNAQVLPVGVQAITGRLTLLFLSQTQIPGKEL